MCVRARQPPPHDRRERTHVEDLEAPRAAVAHEPEDRADVVAEDDLHEEAAVDEACALEDLLVLRETRRVVERVRRAVQPVLVDCVYLFRGILRES